MEYKVGSFYTVKWNKKVYEHCELLEILPGTSLAAVRTPKYEYFEIHTDFLFPENEESKVETTKVEPVTLHLEKPLKSETVINIDLSSFEELVNNAAKSVAEEFKSSSKKGANLLLSQESIKYKKYNELIALKFQECDRVINNEYSLKKEILRANTIKEALLEIQKLVED